MSPESIKIGPWLLTEMKRLDTEIPRNFILEEDTCTSLTWVCENMLSLHFTFNNTPFQQ